MLSFILKRSGHLGYPGRKTGGSLSSHCGEAQDLAKSALGVQKRVSYPLKLELWAVLRPLVGARNEARIL